MIARRHDGWDAIAALLVALDERHSHVLQPILDRLWRVTSEWIYGQGGLYQVLTSAEMLEADPAADREDRRARAGFVAPSSARSFLALARKDDVATLLRSPARDPVTRAFFREYQPQRLDDDSAGSPRSEPPALRELLAAAGPSTDEGQPAARPLLARALAQLAARDGQRHADRMRELGYLANVLLAGGAGGRGGRLRPFDAAEAVLATCNLGLEQALAEVDARQGSPEERAAKQLERLTCDVLFRVGWRLRHDQATPLDRSDGRRA